MLILSYNVRGLGGDSKLTTLCRILDLNKPKVVAFQETMSGGGKSKEVLKGVLKDWQRETLAAEGHLGGMITSSSPDIFFHNKATFKDVIGIELEDPKIGLHFYLLNVYAPFYDRRSYWETLSKSGALVHDNLILVGDLNLTLTTG